MWLKELGPVSLKKGRPYCSLQGGWHEAEGRSLFSTRDRIRVNGLKLHQGRLGWTLGKCHYCKRGQGLKQAPQGGDGAIIPGGVHKVYRHGYRWCGVVLGLHDLKRSFPILMIHRILDLRPSTPTSAPWAGTPLY